MSEVARLPPDDATHVVEDDLWSRFRMRADEAARRQLLDLHMPYARTIAAMCYGRRMHDEISFDDYHQHACLGLLEALGRFDPARGARFRTFAAHRIHGAVLDGIERASEKQQQITLRQRLRSEAPPGDVSDLKRCGGADVVLRRLADVGIGLALCHLFEDTGMVEHPGQVSTSGVCRNPYESLALADLRGRLIALVASLPAQQRDVIQRRYLHDHSFEEIADHLSLTRGRISQIHRQALGHLREQLDLATGESDPNRAGPGPKSRAASLRDGC